MVFAYNEFGWPTIYAGEIIMIDRYRVLASNGSVWYVDSVWIAWPD